MAASKFVFLNLLLLLNHANGMVYNRSPLQTIKRQSGAPEYKCETAIGDYQICYPTTGTYTVQRGNNIYGGISTSLSQEEYPANAGSNRYNVVIQDTDEIVHRQDMEISPYGTEGINLRIAQGTSFSQTWTITETAGIQPEGIGGTLSFAYSETYTVDSNVALSCDVTDPVGVFVVSPAVNHRGGWIIQTDNIGYLGTVIPDQVVTKVFRWDTDIPLKEVGGFIQGIYDCCGGASVPFACCYGSCTHVGGTRD